MFNSLVTFFNKTSPSEVLEHNKPNYAKKNFIYRDELSKIKPTKNRPIKKGNSDLLECSKPLINKESGGKIYSMRGGSEEEDGKEIVRVKVMMTKREANRLLSRCKEGGVLEFKDVARELEQIPVNRVTVLSPPSTCSGGTVLKSIPEEF